MSEIVPAHADPSTGRRVLVGFEASGDGLLHVGHLSTLSVLQRLHARGLECVVLVADLHAWLNQKGSDSECESRAQTMMAQIQRLCPYARVIRGSSLLQDSSYMKDILRLSLRADLRDMARSMPDDLLSQKNRITKDQSIPLARFWYVLMQIVDSRALDADVVLAGLDQRKIYMRQRELYSAMGWESPTMIFQPLLTLHGQKISKSNPHHHALCWTPKFTTLLTRREPSLMDLLQTLYAENRVLQERNLSFTHYIDELQSWS